MWCMNQGAKRVDFDWFFVFIVVGMWWTWTARVLFYREKITKKKVPFVGDYCTNYALKCTYGLQRSLSHSSPFIHLCGLIRLSLYMIDNRIDIQAFLDMWKKKFLLSIQRLRLKVVRPKSIFISDKVSNVYHPSRRLIIELASI